MLVGMKKSKQKEVLPEKTYWYYTATDGAELIHGIAITSQQTFPLSGVIKIHAGSYIITFFSEISEEECERMKNERNGKVIELNKERRNPCDEY